jgi:hypothetical protein
MIGTRRSPLMLARLTSIALYAGLMLFYERYIAVVEPRYEGWFESFARFAWVRMFIGSPLELYLLVVGLLTNTLAQIALLFYFWSDYASTDVVYWRRALINLALIVFFGGTAMRYVSRNALLMGDTYQIVFGCFVVWAVTAAIIEQIKFLPYLLRRSS